VTPTPTPTPLLIEIASGGESAPWWGVPAIAGAFLLIGGFLTYLYARHTERTKADRVRTDKLHEDVNATGLLMLAAGAKVRDLGLLTLRRSPTESMVLIVKNKSTIEEFNVAARRFSITMPPDFQEHFTKYVGSTSMLAVPPYQHPGQVLMLNHQATAERHLITGLRALRKLKPLEYRGDPDFGSVPFEDLLADGLAQDAEYEQSVATKVNKEAPDQDAGHVAS
jgi:hypothetical protein